jgi:hypothetical protein
MALHANDPEERLGITDVLSVERTPEGVRVIVRSDGGGSTQRELLFRDVDTLARLCELLVRTGLMRFESGGERRASRAS